MKNRRVVNECASCQRNSFWIFILINVLLVNASPQRRNEAQVNYCMNRYIKLGNPKTCIRFKCYYSIDEESLLLIFTKGWFIDYIIDT